MRGRRGAGDVGGIGFSVAGVEGVHQTLKGEGRCAASMQLESASRMVGGLSIEPRELTSETMSCANPRRGAEPTSGVVRGVLSWPRS